jgi:hypothetical protein
MNTKTPNTLLFLLILAECTSTTPQPEAEDMVAESTAEHGAADLLATDEQQTGGDGFAWCLLDRDGDTWVCAVHC